METYQSTYIINNILQTLLLLAWLAAVFIVSSLARFKTARWLRRFAWLSFLPLLLIIGLSLGRIYLVLQLAANGFLLVPTPNLWSLPLVLLPPVLAGWFSLPRLWRLSRRSPKLPDALVDGVTTEPAGKTATKLLVNESGRAKAAVPALVVPVQSGAVGAFLSVLVVLAPPSLLLGVICLLLFGAFIAWRWWWQSGLEKKLRVQGRQALLPFGQRIGWSGGFGLVILATFGVWFVVTPELTRLPEHYNMSAPMGENQNQNMPMQHPMKMMSVTELTGPKEGLPDRRFTLVAQKMEVKLSSGQTVEAWTFNGQVPGPELRVRQGELVEVTLENRDIAEGVTIHWHGVNVPNAEDGVAGLTQEAVMPGQRFVYRFQAKESGTYWYHSHQASSQEVNRGLFGAFVVEPATNAANSGEQELVVLAHQWQTPAGKAALAFGLSDGIQHQKVAAGQVVRMRLINTANKPLTFSLDGTPFKVVAIDGVDLNEPSPLKQVRLTLAAGGRYDLGFTMPATPVLLATTATGPGLLLSQDGKGEISPAKTSNQKLTEFNPASYGQPAPTPFGPTSHFDREYTLVLESGLTIYDGRFGPVWLINGEAFPNTPSIMVQEGDLVKITFVNRTVQDHPMHPHGHKMLVLKRNGQAVTGSPWWTDTVNVAPGEVLEVALKADNPGLWIDHCHDLDHAAAGMIMHLMYQGITTPFEAGRATNNHPE
jgi:FtsP/CotA-like multicopper oxidase with cupredoxin domain